LSAEKIAATSTAVAESDGSLKLRTVEKRVCSITNARRIIIALIIVGEGTPLRAGVDDTITEDQSTGAADHVAGRELLNDIRRILSAILAHQRHVEIFGPFCRTLIECHIRSQHLGLVRLCAIDIVKFVKDWTLGLFAADFLALLRYGRSSSGISGRFFAKECSCKLYEEWGMRFGGIDWKR
jgi:hypothetical protein